MNRTCENCRHHAFADATDYKHTNITEHVSVCVLKSILVSPYNHCPKFEPAIESVQLSFSYDANGSPVEEP